MCLKAQSMIMHLIPEYQVFRIIFVLWTLSALTKSTLCFQLQMGTLQSRLDAEFLLAHMCSVKFKEWIVVLATLLRRSEVRLDSFLQALVSKIVGSCMGIVGVLLV